MQLYINSGGKIEDHFHKYPTVMWIYLKEKETRHIFSVSVYYSDMEILLIKPNNQKIIVEMTFRGKRYQVREKPDKPRWVILDTL